MLWVTRHLADLESDFSVFHRIDDIYSLDGPKFFRLAWRISAYKGVIRMRLEADEAERQSPPAAPTRTPAGRTPAPTAAATSGPGAPPGIPAGVTPVPLAWLMNQTAGDALSGEWIQG